MQVGYTAIKYKIPLTGRNANQSSLHRKLPGKIMARNSRGLLAEGLLIVISILVAFSIDAWWEERQDRGEERRILNALRDEFQTNARKIPFYMSAHQLSADCSSQLIQALHEAGPDY